jgi:sarcosine oxidase subunit gamma
MVDAALRTVPVPAETAVFADVMIALGAPLARYSLRARGAKALAGLIGREVPAKIGTIEGDMACLGPDEWLLRAPAGTALPDCAGQPVSVVEISERQVCLVLEGPRAADVLMAGCPRDLDRLAVGRACRTVFEGVEIVVLRTGAYRFEVEVWRSFAAHLHLALTKAAAHLA